MCGCEPGCKAHPCDVGWVPDLKAALKTQTRITEIAAGPSRRPDNLPHYRRPDYETGVAWIVLIGLIAIALGVFVLGVLVGLWIAG